MSVLDHAPRLAVADAVRIARELYGLDSRATPLPSERDQNFLLEATSGRFVLKVSNASEPRSILEAQNAAMAHLADRVPLCPRVVPAADGQEIAREPGGHLLRLVTWRPGVPMARLRHRSRALLHDLGRAIGGVDRALADFDHAALTREFHWDLDGAVERSRALLPLVTDAAWRAVVSRELDAIDARLRPLAGELRRSVIHNDANDHNVLVEGTPDRGWSVSGLIDFGDLVHSVTAADPAVAIAYAVLDAPDPLAAAAAVLAGYHGACPLRDAEIAAVFDLVKLRLCLSACMAARQQPQRPDDEYLGISQAAIRRTLPALVAVHPRLAAATCRHACGLAPVPAAERIRAWLRGSGPDINRVLVGEDPADAGKVIDIDLSVSSPLVAGESRGNAPSALGARIDEMLSAAGARVAAGGYLEPRTLYDSPLFGSSRPGGASRTIHLGLDFFARPGTTVRAALAGTVHAFADNRQPLDYGPVVILRHAAGGDEFYTLYGHLARESLNGLRPGERVARGDRLGVIGTAEENGGWAPHLHFQLITDLLDQSCDFPGVCRPGEDAVWSELSPDPGLIALAPSRPALEARPVLSRRRARIGASVRVAYREPLTIARGWMQYLYDAQGRKFLDAYNNVPHVGHAHPRVVRAAAQQLGVLNTNTRYLHETLVRYAERLAATLPAPLEVCYFVNSGSEANELALRLARTHTRRRDVLVLDSAYHGITSALVEMSPYKFDGPGGTGKPPWVHVAPLPDVYRGPYRRDDPQAATKYADEVGTLVARAAARGSPVAALVAETCPSVAGQIVLPDGYLARVYERVRESGGVCVADEVQTAYGRMGSSFYAFERHGVVPDIVVLGKPIGNGYPLGAVVTTAEIAGSFDNGMELFSTFGGSTVSAAVGLEVLEVVRDEDLQSHADRVGRGLIERLRALGDRHALVGDVRGSGLFLGVELVTDRGTLAPASREADYAVNRLREEGILIGTDGPRHNVLKIRPPMPFDDADADQLAATLDRVLGELG